MTDVFISYSRKDSDMVERIRDSLKRHGLDVWIDQEDIGTGARWDQQIEAGIQTADKILVILSSASVASQNVGDEWSYALEKQKHIIPVMLEACDVPMRIASLQRIEFFTGFDEAMLRLIDEIKGRPSKKRKLTPANLAFKLPKFSKAMTITAALLIVAVCGVVGYYQIPVSVPNVTGLAPDVAEQVLRSHFLKLGNSHEEYTEDDQISAGKIFRTGQTSARLFTPIDIYIAKAKIEVPNLVGLNHQQAQQLLESRGLKVASVVIEEADAPEFTVFEQLPAANALVRDDQTVALHIVKEKIVVPELAGENHAQALAILDDLNLHAEVVYSVVSDGDRVGEVIKTEPAAGSKVNASQPIQLNIAALGGWIYLGTGKSGEVMTTSQGFNLRNDSDSSTRKTIIGQLPKGSQIKILEAKANGWRLVRLYKSEDVETTVGQL
ncbi:TIR domain-containing protein [Halioxenophilus sp. WMMB6]|uniref:TIR domain-containing protein n=1 Tax=Halioxenophilus sp. WMMB6 TaxID=3073815 RepID=UPI00295F1EEF|nr:TIR domain-containing protein [Halioxenophilus sp. WMMB6]